MSKGFSTTRRLAIKLIAPFTILLLNSTRDPASTFMAWAKNCFRYGASRVLYKNMLPNNLYNKVQNCLDTHPRTRDSDAWLTWAVWRTYYPRYLFLYEKQEAILLKNLIELPSQDSIKRIRAKIQNEEQRYLPTSWKVAKQRKIQENVWKQALGY